jgi:hypothetical protein
MKGEYGAIAPSDLVNTVVGDVQSGLNTVFNLDDHLRGTGPLSSAEETEPVTISVEDEDDETEE